MMRISRAGRRSSDTCVPSGTGVPPEMRGHSAVRLLSSAQSQSVLHSQAGMTLLEVVIVLVLFVILSGIAAPKIWTMLHTSSAEREVQSFVRFMQQSVDEARTRQQTMQVTLNMATGTYTLTAASKTVQVQTEQALGGTASTLSAKKPEQEEPVLKKGQFTVFQMEAIQTAARTLDAGNGTISIKRAGIAEEATLVLRNQDDLLTIHILPFRGKTVVYDGAQQLVGKKGI